MNSWAIMVVLIIAISVFGKVLSEHLRAKRKAEARLNGEDSTRMRAEIAQLKDRIATLERLATDKRLRLADEIDALGRDR